MANESIFSTDLFTAESLTGSINKAPFVPGQIAALKLFEEEGIATTKASIELKNNTLQLVPSIGRGAPAPVFRPGQREGLSFECAHLIQRSTLLADSIQDVREFGTTELKTLQGTLDNDHLAPMRLNLEATIEFHRIGAIKGQILDASGGVLIDLWSEFGVSQQSIDVDLDTTTTKVVAKVMAAKRLAEGALGAAKPSGWIALCSPAFFDALQGHPSVENFSVGWAAAAMLRDDVRDSFSVGGVTFAEYRGSYNGTDFIPAGEAYLIPQGIPKLFITRFGPADYAEAVNTLGLPLYAKSHMLPFNRGAMIEAQSNPVNLCSIPRAVIKLTA
ncbi:MAG: major capsid protein [Azonexus sp.]|nr:major capsid protein [Azonexus sp.]